jgi:hypothetical protein
MTRDSGHRLTLIAALIDFDSEGACIQRHISMISALVPSCVSRLKAIRIEIERRYLDDEQNRESGSKSEPSLTRCENQPPSLRAQAAARLPLQRLPPYRQQINQPRVSCSL